MEGRDVLEKDNKVGGSQKAIEGRLERERRSGVSESQWECMEKEMVVTRKV